MSTLNEKIKPTLIVVGVLAALYFIGPFLWSAVLIGVKGIIFHWILDYGFYVFALLGGGGYIWWKTRKKI
jgi:hypothetical protein